MALEEFPKEVPPRSTMGIVNMWGVALETPQASNLNVIVFKLQVTSVIPKGGAYCNRIGFPGLKQTKEHIHSRR